MKSSFEVISKNHINPMSGLFNLPVEVEDGRKPSGINNLSREGWGEDKCRNYLVRLCADVPRNMPYKDGLRILHPRLQERFGDENVDLALGVLEELIEVEEDPPFPPSVFQRWKHEHLRRREDFTNPHVPHTTTIQSPVIPTKTLLDYRERQARRRFLHPERSPTAMRSYESLNSKIAHQPSWRIEHSVYVSTGGKPAIIAYCPTPEELHKGMWDPEYGRKGARVRPDPAQTSPPASSDGPAASNSATPPRLTPTGAQSKNPRKDAKKKKMNQIQEVRENQNDVSIRLGEIEYCGGALHEPVGLNEVSGKNGKERELDISFTTSNVDLPSGCDIPNANFARKHQLVKNSQPIPDYLLGYRRPTFDDIAAEECDRKVQEATRYSDHNPLQYFMSTYKTVPATPSIFFDGGLDYKWGNVEPSTTGSNSDTSDSEAQSVTTFDGTQLPLGGAVWETEEENVFPRDSDDESNSDLQLRESRECSFYRTAAHLSRSAGRDTNKDGRKNLLQRLRRTSKYSSREDHYDATSSQSGPQTPSVASTDPDKTPMQGSCRDTQFEFLQPTIYVPPENETSICRKGKQSKRSSIYEDAESWEERYTQAFNNSVGDLVKWKGTLSESGSEPDVAHLSPSVYNPQISLTPRHKSERASYALNHPVEREVYHSSHLGVEPLSTLDYHGLVLGQSEVSGRRIKEDDKEKNYHYLSHFDADTGSSKSVISPPRRLHERSYLPDNWRPSNHALASHSPNGEGLKIALESTGSLPIRTTMQRPIKTNDKKFTGQNTFPRSFTMADEVSLNTNHSISDRKQNTLDFDGAKDDCLPQPCFGDNRKQKQITCDNTGKSNYNSTEINNNNSPHKYYVDEAARKFLKQLNQGHLPTISPVDPLHIRKEKGQIRIGLGAERQNNKISYDDTRYPPRTSSVAKQEYSSVEPSQKKIAAIDDSNSPVDNSMIESSQDTIFTQGYSSRPTTGTTARSTVSEIKRLYHSGSSGGLLGDFIPIGTPGSVYSPEVPQLPEKMSSNGSTYTRKAEFLKTQYQFEPDTPIPIMLDDPRQTTITDFMQGQYERATPSPGFGHTKNSRSVGEDLNKSPFLSVSSQFPSRGLQRSGSSPSVSPLRFAARDEYLSLDPSDYYADGDPESPSPVMRTTHQVQDLAHRSRAATLATREPVRKESRRQLQQASSSPIRKTSNDYNQRPSRTHAYHESKDHDQRRTRSPVRQEFGENYNRSFDSSERAEQENRRRLPTHAPTRLQPRANHGNESYSSSASSMVNRNLTRSPTKQLVDVAEKDETFVDSPLFPLASPKKRSRSPMKKMFGEHGWLGSSPSEIMQPQFQSMRSSQKTEKPKKTGMMGKIKSKIEEIAEKTGTDSKSIVKNKTSVLSISINPYEQARYLVELELMIVHTANTFLMIEFSQGRMSIDTIKKTVDAWKNRGRPAVVEFMYDQGTQRDLVAANQYNLRFHGERLGDDIRIASMLYNWRQVASLMSVRTFCNADTVLLKLVFDIEQILELIGATEPIMLRLQQLRVSINETIRVTKDNRANRTSNGREKHWDSRASGGTARSASIDDPYGGMKLVPERHIE